LIAIWIAPFDAIAFCSFFDIGSKAQADQPNLRARPYPKEMTMRHIVVIGAGQAGSSLVAKLRNDGFDGAVTLIGAEAEPPYQRPPLSKAYLLGDMALERLYLRPLSFYADHDITLRLGQPVTAIDSQAKTLTVGGETLAYDDLVLTTGSDPRRLPAKIGGALDGVHVVRTLSDVDAMAPAMTAGKRALIVGGGYIGLEAAAVASKLGLAVTLVEMADRILQRVAAPQTSDHFRALHGAHGVEIKEGVGLDHLTGETNVTGAKLTDGSQIDADVVIVGVGIAPASALAESAGVVVDNGIVVDVQGCTSDPSIWAAGDCAVFPYKGDMIRLESVQNAIDQAEAVAANLMGAGKDYVPNPWFWSDQYDTKLQIAGLNTGYDQVVERRTDDAVSFWYYQGDTLLAVDAMNDPRNYMIGKRLIEAGKSPAPSVIADPDTDMKALLKA
jgi:3-phenylpropionate/trans-cinnamate dioxygenase ferredoxin reductase subunit